MASSGKQKTTMAKLKREATLRERRHEKAIRKQIRKEAQLNPPPEALETDEFESGELEPGELEPSGLEASGLEVDGLDTEAPEVDLDASVVEPQPRVEL